MKLLIRHSLRPTLQGCKEPDLVTLSSQGIEQAYFLGKHLQHSVRYCYSSYVPRCIQTLVYILKGAEQSRKIDLEGCLSDDVFTDKKVASDYIRQRSLKESVFNICPPRTVPVGFKDINTCGKMLLDCIFKDIDDANSIDIFCSHDFQLSILVTLMFNENISIESITALWPNMLEGLSFHGERNDFNCIWRNEEKRFTNFLM